MGGGFQPNPVLGWSLVQGRELQARVTRTSSWLCWEPGPLLSPSQILPMGEAVLPLCTQGPHLLGSL